MAITGSAETIRFGVCGTLQTMPAIMRIAFLSGMELLGFFFCVMLVSMLGFSLDIHMSPFHAPLGFGLSVAFIAGLTRCSWRDIGLAAIAASAAIALSCIAAAQFIDISYDGNGYQKAAVVQMAEGWNPLRGSVMDRPSFQELYGSDEYIAMRTALWIDHYAEGPWEIASSLYCLTGSLEASKSYTLIAMIAVVFLFSGYLSIRRFACWQCWVVGLVAAVNPITVCQFSVFYVDGFLMLTLLALLLGLCMTLGEQCSFMRLTSLGIVFMAFCVCANVKFTGLAYAGVFSLSFALLLIVLSIRQSSAFPRIYVASVGITLISAVVFSVVGVGFAPYMTNCIEAGNPLYPLFGEGAVDIMTSNTPPGFSEMPPLERVLVSLFAPVSTVHGEGEVVSYGFKMPFTVLPQELASLAACDLRISGFGGLYSGIFLLCVVVLLFTLVSRRVKCGLLFRVSVAYLVPAALLLVLMGDSWWARYSCYAYFICPLALVCLFWLGNNSSNVRGRRVGFAVGCVLSVLLLVNIGFFVRYNVVNAYEQTQRIKMSIGDLAAEVSDGGQLQIAGQDARLGLVYALREAHVPFQYKGIDPEDFEPQGELLYALYQIG